MLVWRKASRCEAAACVEVAGSAGQVLLRDSKLGVGSPVLTFTAEEWRAFTDAVKAGEFDA